ncbi:MAG: DUF3108 domain-containing protein [Verrucomicrobia bacterium]|jgi:hypothetical protein|nr:DUF3108 domain-containing protein [Verrucomicrobiota bacterium]
MRLNKYPVILMLGLLGSSVLFGGDTPKPPPFAVGERLEYSLKWSVFSVGRAYTEIVAFEERAGNMAWHFAFEARTNAFADRIFKVRTRIDTWVAADLQRTLHYTERKREGKTRRDIVIEFDHENGTATYSNFGKPREPLELGELPLLDPLGAIYHLRARFADLGSDEAAIRLSVTDGKKQVPLQLSPVGRERVRAGGKRWQALRFEPETGELGGVFEKSEDARLWIWMSTETGAYPLLVESEVIVGSFWARLQNF